MIMFAYLISYRASEKEFNPLLYLMFWSWNPSINSFVEVTKV